MKTNELVTLVSNNKVLKADQLQILLKKELEVKEYLSIKDKKRLVGDIVNQCLLYDDGIFKFDDIEKYVCFTMNVIAAYTNIELSDDIEEDYDILCQSKLLNTVINTFKSEYDEVNILLQMKCEYILNDNNVEVQIGKFLNGTLDKIDDIGKVLANKIDSFDVNNAIRQLDLTKLFSLINTYKK